MTCIKKSLFCTKKSRFCTKKSPFCCIKNTFLPQNDFISSNPVTTVTRWTSVTVTTSVASAITSSTFLESPSAIRVPSVSARSRSLFGFGYSRKCVVECMGQSSTPIFGAFLPKIEHFKNFRSIFRSNRKFKNVPPVLRVRKFKTHFNFLALNLNTAILVTIIQTVLLRAFFKKPNETKASVSPGTSVQR